MQLWSTLNLAVMSLTINILVIIMDELVLFSDGFAEIRLFLLSY